MDGNLNVCCYFLSADRALSLYPTLLHFAAKYGLSDFCKTLMKYPGYKSAREMINKDNQTPSEIASEAGHTVLAEDIKVWGYDSEKKSLIDFLSNKSIFISFNISRIQKVHLIMKNYVSGFFFKKEFSVIHSPSYGVQIFH